MKNVILIGGGEIGKGETEQIDSEIKKLAPKGSSFVFFGTAANDAEGYSKVIESVFGDHFVVVSATREKGREFSEAAIKNAAVIYLGGGLTELLMKHFEEWELVAPLAQAIERGVIVVGMSAGAQALSHWYVHEEGDVMEVRNGWDLCGTDVGILVHATEKNFAAAKNLHDKTNAHGQLYGISESAALVFTGADELPTSLGTGLIYRHP